MEAMRVVRMKSGKYAIQHGIEDRENDAMEWNFENVYNHETKEYTPLLFTTEHDADQHVAKWREENQIVEICTELYINEER